MPACTGPGGARDHQDIPQQKQMAPAPHACGGHKQHTSYAHATQVVAGEKRSGSKVLLVVERDGHGVGGHYGAHG
jgi:hypothetical protein